jgi:ArsR family transcriptional regulator
VERASKTYDFALLFAALADRTRLRLLNLMDGREVCVCYFVEILRQSQPKISRHLAYLRRAGIVAARREGNAEMQRDLSLLNQACCAPRQLPVRHGAPVPIPVKRPGLLNVLS